MNVRVDLPLPALDAGWPPVALRETCRVAHDRTVPLWSYHGRRLKSGGCGAAVLEAVEGAVGQALERLPCRMPSRTRLTVLVDPSAGVSVVVQRRLSSLDVPSGVVGVPIVVDGAPELPPGGAKPADRAFWDDAQRRAVAAGGNQAILASPDGVVIDGGTATVLVRHGSTVLTPPSPPAIAGVARAWLIENADRFGVRVVQAAVRLADLDEADEVVYLNAYGGARADARGDTSLARAIQRELDRLWLPRKG